MASIPPINLVAVAHLAFVCLFLGMYLAESVMELYAYFKKDDADLHHAAIRLHYWIDIIVEIPLALGIIGTGIGMALLVDQLTALHLLKISLAAAYFLGGSICVAYVFRRYKLLKHNAAEVLLKEKTKKILAIATAIANLCLTPVILLGAWLAYQRVLEFL